MPVNGADKGVEQVRPEGRVFTNAIFVPLEVMGTAMQMRTGVEFSAAEADVTAFTAAFFDTADIWLVAL